MSSLKTFLILLSTVQIGRGSTCTDNYADCDGWKDFCEGDAWMTENCPKACGKCPEPQPQVCKDQLDLCDDWKDDCEGDAWMEKNCPKTCGKCPQVCKDQLDLCDNWKDDCEGDAWMEKNCPKTCGKCGNKPQPQGSCNCGKAIRISRIVNGVNTEVNEYPWQAGITSAGSSKIWCGGSLINNKYVMTAAHCTEKKKASDLNVLLGEHDTTKTTESETVRMSVSEIIEHDKYDSDTFNYDFSILKLSTTVDWNTNSHIRPVCLPDAGTAYSAGDHFVVTGWGRLVSGGDQPDVLQEVVVNYQTNTDCENKYQDRNALGGLRPRRIPSTMMCANAPGKDSCQGDSGGPLVQARSKTKNNNYALAGVVSWGYFCGSPKFPGVYARVTSVLQWINEKTADGKSCPADA